MEVTITALSDGLVDALSLERLRPKKIKNYNTVKLKGSKRNDVIIHCMREKKKITLV